MLGELISTLKINILNTGFRDHDSEWRYEGVISPFSRIYLVTDGEAHIRHHNRDYHLFPGTLHLVPCFTLADYECPEWFRIYYVHFTSRLESGIDLCNIGKYNYQVNATDNHLSLFSRLVELMPGLTIDKCMPHSLHDKRAILKDLEKTRTGFSADAILEADGIFRQILSAFLRTVTEIDRPAPGYVTEVLEYIEENLQNQISLGDLASLAGRHPNYFSDQFIRIFGVRPIEYINRRRIERAQTLILTNLYSMKQVAAMTGFRDVAYFSRIFKKYAGVPPSQYFAKVNL